MNPRLAVATGCALILAALAEPASAVTTWSVNGVYPDQTTVTGTFDYDGVSATTLRTFAGSGLSAATCTYADTNFFGGTQAPFLDAPAAQATTGTRLCR